MSALFFIRPHYQRSEWADTHKQERMRRPAALLRRKLMDGTMCVLGRLKGKKKKTWLKTLCWRWTAKRIYELTVYSR